MAKIIAVLSIITNFVPDMSVTETIKYILVGINVLTFIVYGWDKWKAKHGKWRISEATLLMLAVVGGTIGALKIKIYRIC